MVNRVVYGFDVIEEVVCGWENGEINVVCLRFGGWVVGCWWDKISG